MTESGKTTLATQLARRYREQGWRVAVLDPLADQRWDADYVTADAGAFLATARASRSLMLFADESGHTIGQHNDELFWLATQARHWGHSTHFVVQRAQQLAKTVRDQCGALFLFNCSFTDAKLLADEWNRPPLREAHTLTKGEYFHAQRFGDLRRHRLHFDR